MAVREPLEPITHLIGMHQRHCDHDSAALTRRAAAANIIRRLQDYARGYADRQAERRS